VPLAPHVYPADDPKHSDLWRGPRNGRAHDGQILPKERSVRVDLPSMERASDAVDALRDIIGAVSSGQMSPNEGSGVVNLIAAYARIINVADLELRLDNVEKKLAETLFNFEAKLKQRQR
jgi:hypothetical protein